MGQNGDESAVTGPGTRECGSTGEPTCPHCRTPLYERHCKYVCPRHGVVIDCSDPFL